MRGDRTEDAAARPPWLAQLEADGFAIVEDAVAASEVDAVLEAISGAGERVGRRNLLRDCPAIARLAAALTSWVAPVLGPGAFAARGLLFDKRPDANWASSWHQDLSIAVAERREAPGFRGWSVKQGVLHVQPPADILEHMLTLRLHLDDCGPDNGPLRVVPGSHRHGRLTDDATETLCRKGEEVACLARRGGILLMRPLLLHASSRAERPGHRRVLHLEYASAPLPHGLSWFEPTRT